MHDIVIIDQADQGVDQATGRFLLYVTFHIIAHYRMHVPHSVCLASMDFKQSVHLLYCNHLL